MYAAAAKKGGADGVSQKVAKEFTSADEPGKLPEHVKGEKSGRGRYGAKQVRK